MQISSNSYVLYYIADVPVYNLAMYLQIASFYGCLWTAVNCY